MTDDQTFEYPVFNHEGSVLDWIYAPESTRDRRTRAVCAPLAFLQVELQGREVPTEYPSGGPDQVAWLVKNLPNLTQEEANECLRSSEPVSRVIPLRVLGGDTSEYRKFLKAIMVATEVPAQ